MSESKPRKFSLQQDFRSILSDAQRNAGAWKLGPLKPNPLQRQGAYLNDRAGSSTEFLDQRPFARGDDIRHINWQAYGRTEQVMVNLYQQESAPIIDIVLDQSRSMTFDGNKQRSAWTTWAFFSVLARDVEAQVRNFVIRGNTCIEAQWQQPDSALDQLEKMPNSSVDTLQGLVKAPLTAGSFRILISDLLVEGESEPILNALSRGAGGLAIISGFSREEAAPDWVGNIEFKDVESPSQMSQLCDVSFVERYKARYQAHFAAWQEAVERRAGVFCRLDVSVPFSRAVAHSFARTGLVVPR